MEWSRSETLAMARNTCAYCQGLGVRRLPFRRKQPPCNCVFRAIFRACYRRFRECALDKERITPVSLDWPGTPGGGRFYGRRIEEYIADFCTVSRHALNDADYQLFRFHYLLGAGPDLCCRRLRLSRGEFFHSVYQIEETLGRVFRELRPYSLFPLDEYFHGTVRNPRPGFGRKMIRHLHPVLRPPLLRPA